MGRGLGGSWPGAASLGLIIVLLSACNEGSEANAAPRPRIDVVAKNVNARVLAVHDGFVYWSDEQTLHRRSVYGGKPIVLERFFVDGGSIRSIAFGCGHTFVGVSRDGIHRVGSGRIAPWPAPNVLNVVGERVVYWDGEIHTVGCNAPVIEPSVRSTRLGSRAPFAAADDADIAMVGSTLVEIDRHSGQQRQLLHTVGPGVLATHGRDVYWGDTAVGAIVRIDRDSPQVDVVVDGFVSRSTFSIMGDELFLAGPDGAVHAVDLESLERRTSLGVIPDSFRGMTLVADPDARELYAALDRAALGGRIVRVALDDLGEPNPRPSWLIRDRVEFRPDGSHTSAMRFLLPATPRLLRDAIEVGRVDILLEGRGPDEEQAHHNALMIRAEQLARLPRTRIHIVTRESPVEEVAVQLRAVNVVDALRVDTERRFVPVLYVSSECARWVVRLRNPSEHMPDDIRVAGSGIYWDLPYVEEHEAFESDCHPLPHALTEPLVMRFTARLPNETVDETQVLEAPRGEPRRFVYDPDEPVMHHAPFHTY